MKNDTEIGMIPGLFKASRNDRTRALMIANETAGWPAGNEGTGYSRDGVAEIDMQWKMPPAAPEFQPEWTYSGGKIALGQPKFNGMDPNPGKGSM